MTITEIHQGRLRIGDIVNVTMPDWQRGEHTVQAKLLRLVSNLLVEVEIKAGIQTHRMTVARHRVTKTGAAPIDADLLPEADMNGDPAFEDVEGLRPAVGDEVTVTLMSGEDGQHFAPGCITRVYGGGVVQVHLQGAFKVLASVDDVHLAREDA